MRRYKRYNKIPDLDDVTAWELTCLDAAEYASDEAEAEMYKATENKNSQGLGESPADSVLNQ